LQGIPKNVACQLDPSQFVASQVEFKLSDGTVCPRENSEEIECLQFDPFEITLMCFGHVDWTVGITDIRL
jgi:hypothetical protein